MLPTSSRKPLLRSSSERERPGMRNWPLFGFLFALVFFFYIVYIYQAQSAELETLRDQFDTQVQLAKTTKREFIEVKAEIERLKLTGSQLVSERDQLKSQSTDCSTNLRQCTLKVEQFQAEKTKFDDSIKEKESQIVKLEKDANEVPSLKNLLEAEQKISKQLNTTVLLLQDEIAALKSARIEVAAEQKVAVEKFTETLAKNEVKPESEAQKEITEPQPLSETNTTPAPQTQKENLQNNVMVPPQANAPPKIQSLDKNDDGELEGAGDGEKTLDTNQMEESKNGPPADEGDDQAEVRVRGGNYDDKVEA